MRSKSYRDGTIIDPITTFSSIINPLWFVYNYNGIVDKKKL